MLSDTLDHRIVLLNDALTCCSQIVYGSQWLQDAITTTAGIATNRPTAVATSASNTPLITAPGLFCAAPALSS